MNSKPQELDLVDEMMWEDIVETCTLEEAGLEESGSQPVFGATCGERTSGGILEYLEWFYDGEAADLEN